MFYTGKAFVEIFHPQKLDAVNYKLEGQLGYENLS